jgi:hypothetical protein
VDRRIWNSFLSGAARKAGGGWFDGERDFTVTRLLTTDVIANNATCILNFHSCALPCYHVYGGWRAVESEGMNVSEVEMEAHCMVCGA